MKTANHKRKIIYFYPNCYQGLGPLFTESIDLHLGLLILHLQKSAKTTWQPWIWQGSLI